MKIADLFVQLGVKTDLKELTAFNQKLKETLGNVEQLQKKIGSDLSNSENEGNKSESKKGKGFLSFLTFLSKGASRIAPVVASLLYIGKAISDVIRKLAKLVLSITGVAYETLKLARNFGVSTTAMQKFGYEAVASGVKLNDFQSALARLKQNSADILLGRGDISPYALLGINPHEDPEQVLIHLQQRLRELPEAIGTAFASDLGLSPDMINYVRKADFSKIANRPSLSQSELKYLDDLRGSALETLNLFSLLGQKILSVFAPLLNSIFKPINNMLSSWVLNLGKLRNLILGITVLISGITRVINPVLGKAMFIFTALGLIIEDLLVHKGEGLLIWFENITILLRMFSRMMNEFVANMVAKIKGIPDWVKKIFNKFLDFGDDLSKYNKPDYGLRSRPKGTETSSNQKVDVELRLAGDVTLKNPNGDEVGVIDSKNIDLSRIGINNSNLSTSGAGAG